MDISLGSHQNDCQLNPGDTEKSLGGRNLTSVAHHRLVQAMGAANQFLTDARIADYRLPAKKFTPSTLQSPAEQANRLREGHRSGAEE
jgi:hypothetical protein